jgi:membrane associated rhomboid family serine protease
MSRTDWTPLTIKPDWRNGVFLYVTVLLLVDFFQKTRWLGLDWLGAGKMDAGLVRQGEWWRCITALTLHADLSHLVGNVVFGALFGLLASQRLGMGLAWFAILVSGMLGNGLNAFVQVPKHTAIGASTAVFAALGILAGSAWTDRRHHTHRSWIIRWAPMVSGIVLLAFLGTGGERTDITAHLTGFLSGGLFGVGFGRLGDRFELKPQFQGILGLSIFAILAFAWLLALGGHGD